MSTITGEVCYRSTTLSLHQNFVKYSSFKNTTITFEVHPDDHLGPIIIKVVDLINFYNKKYSAVSEKIVMDLQQYSQCLRGRLKHNFCYEQLWLYMPEDPNGLKGIICKKPASSSDF